LETRFLSYDIEKLDKTCGGIKKIIKTAKKIVEPQREQLFLRLWMTISFEEYCTVVYNFCFFGLFRYKIMASETITY